MVRSFSYGSLLTGVALAVAAPAFADVKMGVDAWSRGDYAAAIREWKGPADKGDADAQFNLGQAYKLGRGVPQDLAKAEALFAKAAAQGHMQASDNYGLLLFQRGERAKAMPYITAAAGRGDARGQYLLGLAYFNGENVPKDWVRAYALVSLAQQAGLPQAVPALAQMDQHIPLEQRQKSVPLATQLAAEANASRARQLTAADLGTPAASTGAPASTIALAKASSAKTAGADYTRPKPPEPSIRPITDLPDGGKPATEPTKTAATPASAKPTPAKLAAAKPAPSPAKPAPAPTTSGPWRVQLGAFGVRSNADAMWNRVKNRPELASRSRLMVPAGRLTKVQAGGFASQTEAEGACRRLSAAGFSCLAVKD